MWKINKVEGKPNQLVFGIRAVIEAVEAGKEIESLYVQKGIAGDLFRELKTLVEANDIRMQMVPVEKLNRITRGNHQGIIAYISPISFYKVEDIIPFVFAKCTKGVRNFSIKIVCTKALRFLNISNQAIAFFLKVFGSFYSKGGCCF